MSQVGNVEKMYGNTLSIITTNAPGDKILDYGREHVFTENSLIISSPVVLTDTDNMHDLGTPSIICVDYEGKPLRLTYTIQPGDGLITDHNSPDVIRMNIDHHTLNTYISNTAAIGVNGSNGSGAIAKNSAAKGELRVEVDGLIDNNTSLVNRNNNLVVNPGCFVDGHSLKTSSRWYGSDPTLFKQNEIENFKAVEHNPNYIYINKENLCDGQTIIADTSYVDRWNDTTTPERYFSNTPWLANSYTKLKVNTAALEKATKTTYGIVKPDNSTVTISNGELGVKTSGLTRIDTNGGVGVVYVQPSTSNDYVYGDNGKIRLKPQYMPKTQTYNKKTNGEGFGVCAVDGTTISATINGVIKVETGNLSAPKQNTRGVVLPDGKTIVSTDTGKISVNTNELQVGTKDKFGVVKIDGDTIKMNSNNQLYVAEYRGAINEIAELRSITDLFGEQINELRTEIRNLRAQLANTMATIFGLYTNETKNKPFTGLRVIRDWTPVATNVSNSSSGCGSVGVGSSKTSKFTMYINYKPGIQLTWNTSGFKSWLVLESMTFFGADNNGGNLVVMPNNTVTFKSSQANDLYKVVMQFRETKPLTAQSSNGQINMYGPEGELLQSIPVTWTYRGGDYSGSVGTPKTNVDITGINKFIDFDNTALVNDSMNNLALQIQTIGGTATPQIIGMANPYANGTTLVNGTTLLNNQITNGINATATSGRASATTTSQFNSVKLK